MKPSSTFNNETNTTKCIVNKILQEIKIKDTDLADYLENNEENNLVNNLVNKLVDDDLDDDESDDVLVDDALNNELENYVEDDLHINNLTNYMLYLLKKYNVNNTNTLQYSHWVYNNQILMSAIPTNCNDINYIIDKNQINMVISLRENDELYQKCNLNNIKPIFWRFRVPDYGYQDPHDFKALIDNIINYVANKQNKIMIHCLGGHGRTGSVICSIIAILVILQQTKFQHILKELIILNKIPKSNSISIPIIDNIKNKNIKLTNIGILTDFIARKVFVLSQIYVILSLRMYRKTDGIDYRDTIHKILVPETHAQNEMVINVIKLFIQEYVNNGKFMFDIKNKNNCDTGVLNANFEESWKCAKNVELDKPKITNKNDCNK